MSLPVIAIVGRPNVGKSSLLNALSGRLISIVQDMPGVTRDRIVAPVQINGKFVELVDTGGYGFVDPDKLTEHIRQQIEIAMSRANLVLFIVDCQDGLTSADEEIAAMLRRKNIKTVLVANKADGPKADVILGDFARLGLGTPVGVSAMNRRNIDQIFDAIARNIDLSQAPTEIPETQLLVAIVGKRNAGKSTLVNAIASLYEGDPQRVIVSEVPGTTRDSIDVRFEKDGKSLTVIDTAGVRKKKYMRTNDIEFYSFHRAQRSIRRADVVLLLVDAAEPVSEPDKKLAQYIAGEYKPIVIVVNKWDKAKEIIRANRKEHDKDAVIDDGQLMEEYRKYLDEELKHVDYAPIAFITAKEGKNIQSVIDLAQYIYKQASTRLSTGILNRVVRQILQERAPSTPVGQRPRVYYVTQTDVNPPTIVLFVNNPDYISEHYQRFMLHRFRALLPFPEVPIRLVIRPRSERTQMASLDEENEDGSPIEARPRPARVPQRPQKKGARKRPVPAARGKRPPEQKPHPHKATHKGPQRGTRPKKR